MRAEGTGKSVHRTGARGKSMSGLNSSIQPLIIRSQRTRGGGPKKLAPRIEQSATYGVGSGVQGVLVKQLEALFAALRGEALLIATLSYGLKLRLSRLREVRLGDVRLGRKSIIIGGRERFIPHCIVEDLRECVQQRLCGCDASMWGEYQEQPLFSEEGFATLMSGCAVVDSMLPGNSEASLATRISQRSDSRLSIIGALHGKWAARHGVYSESPLELLDKGPRIVRRRTGGAVDSYYLWRAGPVLPGSRSYCVGVPL